jgi:hypothetical protein
MIPPRVAGLNDAKKVPISRKYTGNRALQLMNGATKIRREPVLAVLDRARRHDAGDGAGEAAQQRE